jgi:prepilin peptidase CpaA
MTIFGFAAFNAILLCAAVSDARRYRIPNALPALLAMAGLVLAFPQTLSEGFGRAATAALFALLGGAIWLRGLLGGGDLKLLVACAVWIPIGALPLFLMALGLASGVQGLAALALLRFAGAAPLAEALRNRLPYAVSIAVAGLAWSLPRLPLWRLAAG